MRTPAQRQAQLQQAVTLATWLNTTLAPYLPTLEQPLRTRIQTQLDLIAKVVADESTLRDGQVQERAPTQKGTYRLDSAVDVEAIFRKHAPDPAVFGYKAAIATTTLLLAVPTPVDSQLDRYGV